MIHTAIYSSLLERNSIWYRFVIAADSTTLTPDVSGGSTWSRSQIFDRLTDLDVIVSHATLS